MSELGMIYDLVKETRDDVREIKDRQSEVIRRLDKNDEQHVNCDGKKAMEILSTKGSKTFFFYINNYKQGIAVIIGLLVLNFALIVGVVKAFKEGKEEFKTHIFDASSLKSKHTGP